MTRKAKPKTLDDVPHGRELARNIARKLSHRPVDEVVAMIIDWCGVIVTPEDAYELMR
jgi:hypothetical protein